MRETTGGPQNTGTGHKILTAKTLLDARAAARAEGRRVVHCHGCFDIVHPGHVRHLKYARAQGDILLVSITADALIAKGDGRPLIPEDLRAENLAELDCVDWVYVENRPTAADLLGEVQPDIYIKGREYETNSDPRFQAERETVERHGGRVVFSSGDVVFSSTALIESLAGEVGRSTDPVHRQLRRVLDKPEADEARLNETISAWRGQRVLIVGELIRDTYVFCDRPDVAGESPMMTLRPVEHRCYDGGAAILARHAAAMGARPTLVTALPSDGSGEAMRTRLLGEGIDVLSVPSPAKLPEKQRFLVGTTKMMKLDLVEPEAVDAARRDELAGLVADAARQMPGGYHAAILADFGLGLLTAPLLTKLCETLRPLVGVLAGDVSGRRSGLRAMRGLDLVTPSESELRDAFANAGDGLPALVWQLLRDTESRSAIVTLGAEGLIAFGKRGASDNEPWPSRVTSEPVPALTPHAVDALGCGDALLTTATLSLSAGADLVSASVLGAMAASVQARTLGNVPIDASTLRRELRRIAGATLAFRSPALIEAQSLGMGETRAV
ncbi:MAG: PfkB family carbohydrate kinase [Planctomycetota bacterium]